MSEEREPGQSLAQRGESLPTVPERAGAIVAEVITSIAEEANARAEEVRTSAEAEARAAREAAHEDAGQIRTRLDALAGQLGDLRSGLKEEEERLVTGLRRLGSGEERPALSRADEGSQEPGAPTAPPEQPGGDADGHEDAAGEGEAIVDVELVEEQPAAPEDEAASEADRSIASTLDVTAPGETRARVAAMSDRDLAFAYVDAVRASKDRVAAGMDPARADAVARAVVDEALTRPVFSDRDRHPSMAARIAGVVGRRRGAAIERLREATLEARGEEQGS